MGKEEKIEGLTYTDLVGKIIKVVNKGKPNRSSTNNGQPTLVLSVEHDGKNYQVGIIGKDAIESVLQNGEKKTENGKTTIYFNVPEENLTAPDEKINWINTPY